MRNTKQKDMILQAVMRHNQHPTADDIYQELKAKYPKLSLATVYRNLNQYADMGYLGRISIDGEPVHFDTHAHRHLHAICSECGRIIDIQDEALNRLLAERLSAIEGMEDFKLDNIDVKYIGCCPSCQAKKS